ncbi:hypothetical protein WJX73_006387 [Symbiochloris irregularis]|uniref:Trafficking protein particle complex subunit 11 domain-containing protein n=1 Tax=Symbiochloris irregularis TaxID=706552 RepID=A0AAW1NM42_9CHLO
MDAYPAEIVTPPLALMALLGCPELHAQMHEYLRSHHKPPINSVGVANPLDVGRVFGERKSPLAAGQPAGILKADWFAKHRQRRPAVAVLLIPRAEVEGAPDAWQRVSAQVGAVRGATRAQGARLVLVITSGSSAAGAGHVEGPVQEERVSTLCRQGGIERRWVATLAAGEGEAGLRRVARLLHEAAGQFYLDDSRRRLTLHNERRNPPADLNARVAFKAAALSEFRGDWSTAVRSYEAAYREIAKAAHAPGSAGLQRFFEIAAVAELMHLKVIMLLLHQQNTARALAQFKDHLKLLKKKEAQPSFFQNGAVQAAIKRRKLGETLRNSPSKASLPPGGSVGPGAFVGQLVMTQPGGAGGPSVRKLSDAEFLAHLEAKECSTDHGALAVQCLQRAEEFAEAAREQCHYSALVATEHRLAGNPAIAKPLLESIAGVYRREGWRVPLSGVLQELRLCSKALDLTQDVVAAALELCVLQDRLDIGLRSALAAEAALFLAGAQQSLAFTIDDSDAHPLHGCFALTWGFEDAESSPAESSEQQGTGEPGPRFVTALWSNVPCSLHVTSVQVAFITSRGTHTATASVKPLDRGALQKPPPPSAEPQLDAWGQATEEPSDEAATAVTEASSGFLLEPGRWVVAFAQAPNPPNGKIGVQAVTLRLGQGSSSISWPLATAKPDTAMIGAVADNMEAVLAPLARLAATQGIKVEAGAASLELPPSQSPPQLRVEALGYAIAGEKVAKQLSAGGAKRMRAWVDVPVKGQLHISACLTSTSDEGETLTAEASLEVTVERPFQVATHTSGPARTSTLLLPISALPETTDAPLLADRLPVGQACLLSVDLTITAPAPVVIMSVALEPPVGVESSAVQVLQSLGTVSGGTGAPVTLSKGEAHTARFVIRADSACTAALVGEVAVTWKRPKPARRRASSSMLPKRSSRLISSPRASLMSPNALPSVPQLTQQLSQQQPQLSHRRSSSLTHTPTAAAMTHQMAVNQLLEDLPEDIPGAGMHPPPQPVTTKVPLPRITFAEPGIVATSSWPASVRTGEAFTLDIGIANRTQGLQRVQVAVGDTSGFVFAGDRRRMLALQPQSSTHCNLQVVAHASGPLPLPQLRLTAPAHDSFLDILAGHTMVVLPSPISHVAAA